MSVDWSETKSIMLEVEQLFTRDDDVRDVQDVKKMANEIQIHQGNNLKTAKDIIKRMTIVMSEKEAEVMAPSMTSHSAKLEKFVGDKENVDAQIEAVRGAVDSKRENITKMATSALTLKEKAREFEGPSTDLSDSRTAYALSLYAKITNIAWDYDKSSTGNLSGCVGSDAKKEFHKFSIDTRSETSFDVADALWEKIAEGLSV